MSVSKTRNTRLKFSMLTIGAINRKVTVWFRRVRSNNGVLHFSTLHRCCIHVQPGKTHSGTSEWKCIHKKTHLVGEIPNVELPDMQCLSETQRSTTMNYGVRTNVHLYESVVPCLVVLDTRKSTTVGTLCFPTALPVRQLPMVLFDSGNHCTVDPIRAPFCKTLQVCLIFMIRSSEQCRTWRIMCVLKTATTHNASFP